MNYKFKVEFAIFDKERRLSETQLNLRKSLMRKRILNDILKNEFKNDENYKYLDRSEASISSIDETKQLRLQLDNYIGQTRYEHSLHFHQNHSCSSSFFTFEELKYISYKIKNALEVYLKYEIDEPIIYIAIDDL